MKKIVMLACVLIVLTNFQSYSQEKSKDQINLDALKKEKELALAATNQESPKQIDMESRPNLSNFVVKDIDGNDFYFEKLKGKRILIVNTASKCGYTPQYKELESLYQKLKDKNFIIIGFPSNDFGKQEPGSNEEIKGFCEKNYGVSFPMMSKVVVKGSEICELYQFLTQKEKNGFLDSNVEWNFQKYLINENGQLEKVFKSKDFPTIDEMIGSNPK